MNPWRVSGKRSSTRKSLPTANTAKDWGTILVPDCLSWVNQENCPQREACLSSCKKRSTSQCLPSMLRKTLKKLQRRMVKAQSIAQMTRTTMAFGQRIRVSLLPAPTVPPHMQKEIVSPLCSKLYLPSAPRKKWMSLPQGKNECPSPPALRKMSLPPNTKSPS